MPEYVADTHALIWALSAPAKLGARARRVFESDRDRIWLPAAAVAEIALLRELGRTGIGMPELATVLGESNSLRFLELTWHQLHEFAALSAVRDPFDRLIVSAARARRARLISKDESIASGGLVDVVWR